MSFKKFLFAVTITVILSCSIIEKGEYNTGYYIFSVLKVGDDRIRVIVDSTLSIKDSLNSENNFVLDAIVKINGNTAYIETLNVDSAGYKYVYLLNDEVLPEREYEIEVKIDDKIFTAKTFTPESLDFLTYSDSAQLKIDSSLILIWNSSGIGFYMVQIKQKNEYGSFFLFETGIENDTFLPIFNLSYLFPDTGTYDFFVISYDSSYFKYMTDEKFSSFVNGYGLFGSVSVGVLKDVKLFK
ncbi:MAG: hypothetical protein ABIN00_06525 [candidate division WOR-3 bacterium]